MPLPYNLAYSGEQLGRYEWLNNPACSSCVLSLYLLSQLRFCGEEQNWHTVVV